MPSDPSEAAWWVLQTIFWLAVYLALIAIALYAGWWILKALKAILTRTARFMYQAVRAFPRFEAESARRAVVTESAPKAIVRALLSAVGLFAASALFGAIFNTSDLTGDRVTGALGSLIFALVGYRFCQKAWRINANRKKGLY